MPKHTKLCLGERRLISFWRDKGLSTRESSRRLGRSPSTVCRELVRNRYWEKDTGISFYEPLHAEEKAKARQGKAWEAKHPLRNQKVFAYVMDYLRQGWSPEQVSGRMKTEHSNDNQMRICPEAVYRFIYSKKAKALFPYTPLWEYLRRKQAKRRKQKGRSVHRLRIPDRVSIHQRPVIVDERDEIGHWEGDTLVGKARTNGLHTAYERFSSLVRLERMERLTADESIKAQNKIYRPLPSSLRKSTTLDNGLEHVKHTKLNKDLGMKTYFADPYSAWQRGGNENANLWIRYYFPKGTDFSKIPYQELKDVEWELNNRPRKRLGFRTPQEVFTEYLECCVSK